ncbi:hypothetical protein [[Micrococcus luteus] ATCC 49442]|uniref:hypothetical protein n=1 Tax=[Micrococcus luteus] ATCC 49442 TaxID=2698727 RepID=UPI0013DC03FA|nr:hypothetical protein [[Micrococcus luteus] ATCC 49442]
MSSYNIADLVKNVLKTSKLPAKYEDLDEQTKRRLQRQADAEGTTPHALYEVIKMQREKDLREDSFDPDAIARAARGR